MLINVIKQWYIYSLTINHLKLMIMKKRLLMMLFLVIPLIASSQESSISKFALSVNPVGFIQIGP